MGWKSVVDRYFQVSERGSTVGTEVKAGVVTFLTASYILLVNPQILGAAGLPIKAVVAATALSATVASLICGLISNLPVCVSPGMGLNAYFVYSQVLGLGIPINKALAGCLVAAAVVALLAALRALHAILVIVPDSIKLAVVIGMGLLLSFIGLCTSKVVVADPETMVRMGDIWRLEPLLAIAGLAAITALHYRNVRGSIIIGVMATAAAYFAATASWPAEFVALPHLEFFAPDFSDLFTQPMPAAWSAVLAYTLVMVFDIGGAMFGLCNLAGLLRDGRVRGATWTYLAAATGTALGALTGTTPLIIAAESAVGIKEGGRTGLVAVTVAGCFALSMLLAPLLQAIPQLATAPVLVLVGAMMMGECTHIDWGNMLTAVPAFLTIVIQPFTFSIANGIYAGLAMASMLYLLTGQFLPLLGHKEGGAAGSGEMDAPLLYGIGVGSDSGSAEQVAVGPPPGALTIRVPPGAVPPPGSPLGSGGGHSYERSSFMMLTNTRGSQGTTPLHGSLVGTPRYDSLGGTPRHGSPARPQRKGPLHGGSGASDTGSHDGQGGGH